MERTVTYLPDPVHAELVSQSAAQGRTVAGMVRWIVEQYLAADGRES